MIPNLAPTDLGRVKDQPRPICRTINVQCAITYIGPPNSSPRLATEAILDGFATMSLVM